MAEHGSARTTHAYVLLEVEPPKTRNVVEHLKGIRGAVVHEVLGPFDIVVELEVESPEYITSILREKIRPVNGVIRTVTCTWMEE